MTVPKRLQQGMVWLACCGVCLPTQQAKGDERFTTATKSAELVDDVAIDPEGILTGRVLNSDGKPVEGTQVDLVRADDQLASTTTTAENGSFQFEGVAGGVYRILAVNHSVMVRAWTSDAAPPNARNESWIVVGDVVRAQGCSTCGDAGGSGCGNSPLGWLLIGAAIAAAIAIPLALDDDDGS